MSEPSKNRVLVINDDPDSLGLMSFIFRQAGYLVLTADDGAAGLETAKANLPELIICDVMMPGLDGFEVCRLLREDDRLQATPVILISAFSKDAESIIKALDAGADDYIEVPFEPMRLIAKAAGWIERKQIEAERTRFFDMSLDMLCIVGGDGYFKRLNPVWKTALGFTEEEFLSEPLLTFVNPEDREKVAAEIKNLVVNGETLSLENRFLCKDGGSKRLSWKAALSAERRSSSGVSRNTTRCRAYERSLIESKEQIASILESITDGFFALDHDWRFTYVNTAAERIWQYSRAELLGKSIWEVFPSAAETGFYTMYQRVMHERIPLSLTEYYPPTKVWREATAYAAKDGISVYFRDITERRKAEDAIRESEAQFRAVFDNSLDAIMIIEDSGRYIDANPAAAALFGLSREEIITCRIEELVSAGREKEFAGLWRTFLENGTQRGAYQLIRRDKEIIEVEYSATANFLPGQHLAVLRNVTERKRAEEDVRRADQRALAEYERLIERISRLAAALGMARNLLSIYRALGAFAIESTGCSGIFVSLYDAKLQLRLPAYAYSEGAEVDISELPPMLMNETPHSRAVATGQLIITDDFQTAIKGQTVFHVGIERDPALPQSSLVAPMSIMGRIIGAVEIQSTKSAAFTKEHATAIQMAANLTANAVENIRLLEQEHLKDEQLRQSQKLEAVGKLAGGIAHDFNNMLTAINGYSDLTLRRLESESPLRSNIEEIRKAGARSASLTHQLLAFSRQQMLQPKILDLNEIITDTSKMLRRLIGEDIQLNLMLNPKTSRVKVDPGQFTQVIMNLALNARDAMPKGGTITIETANVELDRKYAEKHFPTKPGKYVMLAVIDTGSGMSEDVRQQIFEPFFTTKPIGQGTGLGLSTVYGIIKQSGGYIWAESELGQGSAFRIYLPPEIVETKYEEEIFADQPLPKGKETILLVEDEEMVRLMTIQILEECGYQIMSAASGMEALEICAQPGCRIDLLMTDMVMPGINGYELAKKLTESLPELKVLFTSGYTDDAMSRRGITETDINFIQKPFTFDALAAKIRAVLDSQGAMIGGRELVGSSSRQ